MHRPIASVLIAATLATPAVAGDPTPTDLVDYRETYFEGLSKHMKAIGMVVKGKVARPADLAGHAQAIAAVSDHLTGLFPAGTGPDAVPTTEALPAVWTDPDGFKAKAAAFSEKAKAFAAIAAKGDLEASKAAFFAVGKACGDCHDTFRKDDH